MRYRNKIPNIVFVLIFIILTTINTIVISQNTDTLQPVNIEFITDQLENIAQSTDINLDYSDLLDDYIYYSKNPININSNNISILRDMYLLTDIQLNNLRIYRNQFGQLYSIYELLSISGYNESTVKKLQPFIEIGSEQKSTTIESKKIFTYGKHSFLLRADRTLESKKGYNLPPDSAIAHPGSVYLGDPQHYYLRYSFNYNNKIRAGFTMDKDAGEIFLKSQLSDSIRSLVGNKIGIGSDFLSVFAYAEDLGFIRKIVVGDYHLEFGQGLTIWSGLAFGKSAEAVQIQRFERGIRPNTSANENRFFRGAAASLKWKKITFTPFYSNNNVDGNIVPYLENQENISSIIETGMHRTINELVDKNTINVQIIGGNLSWQHHIFKTGVTVYNTQFNHPISPSNELYKYYNFRGDNLLNYGIDMTLNLKKLVFFGEFSGSSTNGYAGIAGINTYVAERLYLTFIYHNYGSSYSNFYNNPFANSSLISNESGYYFGYKSLISKSISISGYFDFSKFPWLKYNISTPSISRDLLCQVNYNPTSDITLYTRYRYNTKTQNYKEEYSYMPLIGERKRHEFRFFISYSINKNITLKNRFDMIIYSTNYTSDEKGFLFYQDILYRPQSFPLDATFRFSLFSTDGYNSRIYTYENDVLYAFSVPSYFNNGQRWYLMLKWKIVPNVSMWLRYARTTYYNKLNIGSGNELIDGNHRSDVKVEFKIKL